MRISGDVMTEAEVAQVSAAADRVAGPLTLLALVWLLANPDRSRTNGTRGSASW